MEGHSKSTPISRLPLITMLDTKHHLKDFPVYQVRFDDSCAVVILNIRARVTDVDTSWVLAAISLGAQFLQ